MNYKLTHLIFAKLLTIFASSTVFSSDMLEIDFDQTQPTEVPEIDVARARVTGEPAIIGSSKGAHRCCSGFATVGICAAVAVIFGN